MLLGGSAKPEVEWSDEGDARKLILYINMIIIYNNDIIRIIRVL